MAVKPRLVLVDAGAVIHSHRINVWPALCTAYEIVVPSIVASEAMFFIDENGKRVDIDISADIASATVTCYEASSTDVALASKQIPPQLRRRVHEGELEAITWLLTKGTQNTAFLSADGAAIEATVVLGCSDVAMSLQEALRLCGLSKKLPYEHTEAFITEAKNRGGITLVQFGIS